MQKFTYSTLLIIVIILGFVQLTGPAHAWLSDSYYVQEVENTPVIDGIISENEWQTDEEGFIDTITDLNYFQGTIDTISIEVVVLRNSSIIFFLVKILTDISDSTGNISIGIALSHEEMSKMQDSQDRKIVYWSSLNEGITYSYDLFNCGLTSECINTESLQPGLRDTNDVIANYGTDGIIQFFEIAFPLQPEDVLKDLEMKNETSIKILVNPYANIVEDGNGHGGIGTKNLILKLYPRDMSSDESDSLPINVVTAFFGLSCLVIIHVQKRMKM